MKHIRHLGEWEHDHLERYNHGKQAKIIHTAGYRIMYSRDVPGTHGCAENNYKYGKYRDKHRHHGGLQEAGLFNTINIVLNPDKLLSLRDHERLFGNICLLFEGVNHNEKDRINI